LGGERLLRGRIYYVDGGDFITLEGRLSHGGDYFTWHRLAGQVEGEIERVNYVGKY